MSKKKVEIDGCIGCQVCSNIAPESFKIDSGGIAEVISQKVDDNVMQAANECPVEAIIIN